MRLRRSRMSRKSLTSRKPSTPRNSNKYLWNLDFINDNERLFVNNDDIKDIDKKENEIHDELYKIKSMEIQKDQMANDIRHKKIELNKKKKEYRKLLKEGKYTIKMDLNVGDIIPMKYRLEISKNGSSIALHFEKLGYVYSDIEIVKKTDKSIRLKYDIIRDNHIKGMDITETIEKTLTINNFKQIYLQLFSDEDIKLMVRDNTINEVLIEN